MIDNDIKEMFYKKNREIIKNKLILDLDNNMDSLVATIENIIYLEFAIYKEKILNIDINKIEKKKVEEILENYQKYVNERVVEFIEEKKEKCSSYVNEVDLKDGISDYELILKNTTNDVKDRLISNVESYIDDDIVSSLVIEDWYLYNDKKIGFYLNGKLGKDLFEKIILQLKDRDKIIYNNASESYEKYLSLNNNIK